ncbi:MAG: cation:proton antiporter [Proteobacteria bacterium]|nr:cation:proton antiporter [Pseudomonadota bacterium]
MHFPGLIQDLSVILGVAAIVTFIFKRIKQPVVLGYIIAGVIVGPHTPAIFSVGDTANIKIWAELGIIFLMFSLGLEFSFRRLAKVGVSAVATGLIQIFSMICCGFFLAKALSLGDMEAIFFGSMIAISSTTIILKAFEELQLKGKKFAEFVFGILIVQDLVAILMMVALTSIAATSQIVAVDLMFAGLKLIAVVMIWFVVGMFVVPRFVKSVSKHGNDEMLTVVATALCLALVALAAHFNYSVALGAFIMGSILAESAEVKRIESLVQPLKDIFGAIFFVSVGMLIDPDMIAAYWKEILIVSTTVILGMSFTISIAAILTGQTLRNGIRAAFSMTQIGEFSFIIASLGLTYDVISAKIYPIIVLSSVLTTFTTPYLIKASLPVSDLLESHLPSAFRDHLNNYLAWVQRKMLVVGKGQYLLKSLFKYLINGVVVVAIFTVAAENLVPILNSYLSNNLASLIFVWFVAFSLSAPSIWAMIHAFVDARESATRRSKLLGNRTRMATGLVTIFLVGLMSLIYFSVLWTLVVTFSICMIFLVLFRKQLATYYRWIEVQFHSGFQADIVTSSTKNAHQRLAPWDTHLVEIPIPVGSDLIGKNLESLRLRERFSLSVVVISREGADVVAPKADAVVYPGDKLLCFATESEIETFKQHLDQSMRSTSIADSEEYELRRFKVDRGSKLVGVTIGGSGIREKFDCMVVGIERNGSRIPNPVSSTVILDGDLISEASLCVFCQKGTLTIRI